MTVEDGDGLQVDPHASEEGKTPEFGSAETVLEGDLGALARQSNADSIDLLRSIVSRSAEHTEAAEMLWNAAHPAPAWTALSDACTASAEACALLSNNGTDVTASLDEKRQQRAKLAIAFPNQAKPQTSMNVDRARARIFQDALRGQKVLLTKLARHAGRTRDWKRIALFVGSLVTMLAIAGGTAYYFSNRPKDPSEASFGGPGGVRTVNATCKKGYVLAGLSISKLSQVRSAQPICKRLDPKTKTVIDSDTQKASLAGKPGKPTDHLCPKGSYAVGIHGAAGQMVDRLGLICSNKSRSGAFGGPGGTPFETSCLDDDMVTGLRFRAGDLIDSVGLTCGKRP